MNDVTRVPFFATPVIPVLKSTVTFASASVRYMAVAMSRGSGIVVTRVFWPSCSLAYCNQEIHSPLNRATFAMSSCPRPPQAVMPPTQISWCAPTQTTRIPWRDAARAAARPPDVAP